MLASLRLSFSLIAIFLLIANSEAQDKKLVISGFSELRYTSRFGDPASEEALEAYEAGGGDEELTETNGRLSSPGFNTIITSQISDKFTFQGEVVFSFEEEEFETELLRAYADYKLNPKFNIQVGKFLSPIGYLNRNQRFYGYLNYSVRPRDLVDKELGFIPSFTVGTKIYGSFDLTATSALQYQVAFGGMRGLYPEAGENISGIEFGEDESNSPGFSGLVEYLTFIGDIEMNVGFSAYRNGRIVGFDVEDGEEVPIGEEAEELEEDGLLDREEMNLSEIGIAPYFRLDAPKFQFLGEYHYTKFSDEEGNLARESYDYHGYSFQILYKTSLAGKPLYPYVRFDGRDLGNRHPYYGLEAESDEELEKSFVPNVQELIFGVGWDPMKGNRLKMEYGRFLDGPFPSNEFRLSTSFGF